MKELLEHLMSGLTPGQSLFFIACLLAILTTVAYWCISKLVEFWFNLVALYKQQKTNKTEELPITRQHKNL